MRILGIDPGSTLMGFGVIEKNGSDLLYVDHGVLRMEATTLPAKLLELSQHLERTLRHYRPNHAGIETLFFAKNKKTALQVAQARGVIIAELLKAHIPVSEHHPADVKIAVTGYGRSDKQSVAKMVMLLLHKAKLDLEDNAIDALAVAIAAANELDRASRGL